MKQERSMFDVESYAYRGPAVYDGQRYRKLDVTDEEEGRFAQDVKGGWIASMQHHFVSAAVPPAGEQYHFTLGSEADPRAPSPNRGPAQDRAGRHHGRLQREAVRRPEAAGATQGSRPAPRASPPTTASSPSSPTRCSPAAVGAPARRQLGWAIIIVTILLKLAF